MADGKCYTLLTAYKIKKYDSMKLPSSEPHKNVKSIVLFTSGKNAKKKMHFKKTLDGFIGNNIGFCIFAILS